MFQFLDIDLYHVYSCFTAAIKSKRAVILFGIVALMSNIKTQAQNINETIPISKLTGPIKIDGQITESEWMSIKPLPLTMHWPNFKGDLTEQTEIRIAYDDQYIYIGAICQDRKPSGIQTPTFQRDDWGMKMDQITIELDTYDDNENGLLFSVTPTGSRIDVAIKNDAQGGDIANTSWNSYWTAETTINDTGWQAEIKIPFSSLRFKTSEGNVEMGLIAYRYIARKREMQIYPAIPADWGFWSFAKPSQGQTISFEGLQNKRPYFVSPYVLGGIGHHYEEDDTDVDQRIKDQDFEVGLDVQHAFGDNLNADFTFNTDFAQVEADNQVVNLSRFSLFFPEKRKFFLERASIFEFRNDGNNQMFYSRQIGINDGERIPIWGGVRMVGRFNKWDVGLLNMQSRKVDEFASENFGVLRLRKNVFNPRSYIGGMMTSRIDGDGRRNFAYGIDGIINVFGQDYLQINLAQTQDTEDESGIKAIDRSRLYLMWEKRTVNGFGYRVSYSNVGDDYTPGLGFERRKNFSQIGDQLFYNWFAPVESRLRQTTIRAVGNVSFNNTTNKLETSSVGLEAEWDWERGTNLEIGVERFRDVVPEEFDLSDDISIQSGDYSNTAAEIEFGTPQVNYATLQTNLKIGTFYGGNLVSLSFSPEVVFSKYFQISGFYEFNNIDFPDLNQSFKSHVARINMKASLNVKLSVTAFAQLNTLDDITAINFRLRYNPVDGNDFYLVYNEVLNNDPGSVSPRLPGSEVRALIVKYIHTFRL
ncbi:MAG: carbohydrate binding family 9 domain-containing protein [Flavobacteriaceae bacterium]|nr:carbohydrate binding family 9 domain-containing protein [Bacteroidia bacterium]MBT8288615.1 carbohydrate binding family 9 domain-containing protein [Bacteroidia bacterium]NNF74461.1 carbohydrate binding family 9 domain-containing protein [Flavobacteriaceae bacterium]NNL80227.1 carbohydrate binding family 9 domain-containing protein [Flavobacteriaceae bacterium]